MGKGIVEKIADTAASAVNPLSLASGIKAPKLTTKATAGVGSALGRVAVHTSPANPPAKKRPVYPRVTKKPLY